MFRALKKIFARSGAGANHDVIFMKGLADHLASAFSATEEVDKQRLARALNQARVSLSGCPDVEALCGYCDGVLWEVNAGEARRIKNHLAERCSWCEREVHQIVQVLTPTQRRWYWGRRLLSFFSPPTVWRWGPAAAVAMGVVVSVGLVLVEQRHIRRELEAHRAVEKMVVDATTILSDLAESPSAQVRARSGVGGFKAEDFRVIPAVANGRTYPFPVLGGDASVDAAMLAEFVESSPKIRKTYERGIQAWGMSVHRLRDYLLQQGRAEDAIHVLNYLRSDPGKDQHLHVEIMLSLAQCLKHVGHHDQAVEVLREVIAQGFAQDDPRVFHYLGWSFYELERFDLARDSYQKALRTYEEAAHRYQGPRPAYSSYAKLHYNFALLYKNPAFPGLTEAEQQQLRQEHLNQAFELTRQAWVIEGNKNPRVPFTLALLYAHVGQGDQALRYLEKAIQIDRTYVTYAAGDQGFRLLPKNDRQKFQKLLERYKPFPENPNSMLSIVFDPSVFAN